VQRLQWIEEGAFLVAPGVHRIPLPLPFDGLRAVNVYAIEAGDHLVLIDSGWALANVREQLERSLAAIGASLRDVRKFLITHVHRDHYTQAVELRQLFGTPIALGADEKHSLDRLLQGDYRALSAQLDLLATAGAAPVIQLLAEMGIGTARDLGYAAPDEWLISGQDLDLGTRTLEAIATPGHTRGHVVFVDRADGLLFAGDHVLPHITPSIAFEAAPPPLPLRDYLESLNVVRRLPDLTLLPAHGPVSPSSHARVDELVEHHAQRLQAMAAVLAGGALTAYDVAQAVAWTSRQRKLTDLDPVNQALAICETAFHLDLLVAQGEATAELADGLRLYHLTPGLTCT
jgi:glyoxylase-like metal-dependent hydrolase (beta-lactamase superfamily II)